jgi:hypothetical protein
VARGNKAQLSGGRELSYLTQKDALFGSLIQRIITAVNTIGENTAVSPTGKLSAPAPIDSIDVQGTLDKDTNTLTVPSEHLHWTMTHNASVQKGVQYITEIDTDPNFPQPHVIDHGCSRSGFVSLPAMNGDQQNVYYMRSYPQYHGSDPAPRTTLGGRDGAIKIVLTPPASATGHGLLASKGSGTASRTGQQGGKGLGTVLKRPAPGPQRNLQQK